MRGLQKSCGYPCEMAFGRWKGEDNRVGFTVQFLNGCFSSIDESVVEESADGQQSDGEHHVPPVLPSQDLQFVI